jgi:hypothetical protein
MMASKKKAPKKKATAKKKASPTKKRAPLKKAALKKKAASKAVSKKTVKDWKALLGESGIPVCRSGHGDLGGCMGIAAATKKITKHELDFPNHVVDIKSC